MIRARIWTSAPAFFCERVCKIEEAFSALGKRLWHLPKRLQYGKLQRIMLYYEHVKND